MIDCQSTCATIMAAEPDSEVVSIVRNCLASFNGEKAALLPSSLLALGINYAKDVAQLPPL